MASLLIVVVVLAGAIWRSLDQFATVVAVLALVVVFVLAMWVVITRARTTRAIAVAVTVGAGAAVIAVVVAGSPLLTILSLVLLALAVALGRYALGRDVRTLKRAATVGDPVAPARHGVLIMNLRSGGGKAERYDLVDECRRRGIEAVVLQPGDDLVQLARDAIDRGADVIGMAGGDGSQALVAAVAAERGVPMVVVPAGTRNHLALDLGLDRDDVVGALDAFGDAVERPMDLSEVNGRVFVNNVSLGLYAAIVQSPEYRDAKLSTVMAALPKMLGPGSLPMELRYVDPAGAYHDGAHMIQVSNGPYGESVRTMGSRARLDAGMLGMITLVLPDDAAATRFLTALSAGHPERYPGFLSWSATSFEVGSGEAIAIGLDGESLELDPPLHFVIRPKALRVRLAHDAIGYSPAARAMPMRDVLPDLWRVARGREVPLGA